MSKLKIALLSALITMGTFTWVSAQPMAESELAMPSDEISKLSEAFGHLIGENLDAPGFRFDLESIVRGMRNAAEGRPSPMSEREYDIAIAAAQQRAHASLAKTNLESANSFLAKNGSEEGVVSLEDGKLQYRIEVQGSGQEVAANSAPLIHYTGRYLDGTQFDTSKGGDPIALPLNRTIPGFGLGLVGMKEGEKRTLYIHPDLGYGATGPLLPNSLLVFEVEIVSAGSPAKGRPMDIGFEELFDLE